ncbi:MAG: Cell division protein FtsH, partial [uncultured Ramlibacter sp.]
GRRLGRAVRLAHAGPDWLPVLPAQGPVQVAQVHRAGAGAWLPDRPGRHGRHQVRGRADQGPVHAARRVRGVRHQQAVQRDVQRPGRHRQDQARQLPGQGAEPADPVPLGREPGNRLRRWRREHAGPHCQHGQAAQEVHRLPGRGAGPVHEARRPPQVRRRHAEHAAGGAGRRAHQERRRDHLDRRLQLQQRIDADGRGHAAPLPDEGRLPPAEPRGARLHHPPLPVATFREGAARPGPAPPGGDHRGPQPGRPGDHRQPGRHHRGAGRPDDRRRHADAGRRAGAGGQRQHQHHQGARARPAHHRHPRVGPLPGRFRAGAQEGRRQLGSHPVGDEDPEDLAEGQPAQQRAGLRVPQAGRQPAQDQGRHRARRARAAGRHGQRGAVLRRGRHDQRRPQRHHSRHQAAAPRRRRNGHVPQDAPELRRTEQRGQQQGRRRGNAQHHGGAERAPLWRDQGAAGTPEAADRAPGRQADGRRRDEPARGAARDPQLRGRLLHLQQQGRPAAGHL